jgi:hypothetical protein
VTKYTVLRHRFTLAKKRPLTYYLDVVDLDPQPLLKRASLQKARVFYPQSARLWLKSIGLELQGTGDFGMATDLYHEATRCLALSESCKDEIRLAYQQMK